jgi:hypothetical protein
MSLQIDQNSVSAVLLVDGWHPVEEMSFYLDSYEYVTRWHNGVDKQHIDYSSHRENEPRAGFSFRQGDETIAGPITAILAVKHNPEAVEALLERERAKDIERGNV